MSENLFIQLGISALIVVVLGGAGYRIAIALIRVWRETEAARNKAWQEAERDRTRAIQDGFQRVTSGLAEDLASHRELATRLESIDTKLSSLTAPSPRTPLRVLPTK